MTFWIKNGGYALLIRLDLTVFYVLMKRVPIVEILNELSMKH